MASDDPSAPSAQMPLWPRTVVIIDDHDIVRFGLETLVLACRELRLAGSAANLAAGLRLIEELRPDLVISDMGTGDSNGLETVRSLLAAQQGRPLLVVSIQDELLYGEQVLALGARGYLMKEHAHAFVIPATLAILRGGTWASPRLSGKLLNRVARKSGAGAAGAGEGLAALSTRELEVLELLKKGKTTKEIAAILDLSVRTVDVHRARIKGKLGLRTGAELIAFASHRL